MPYFIGIVLALGVACFARIVGFDRDRAFYPTVLIIIASMYGLFAVLGGSMPALFVECACGLVFVALAVVGFKQSAWLIVAGIVGHGLFDFIHAQFITDPGVPVYWPAFCGAYDVTAGLVLAWLLRRSPPSASHSV